MGINTKEMKTIKEWAKIAGLTLYNYDGFVEIYLTLSGKKSDDLYDYQVIRSRDCGDLLCTIRGFRSGLAGCTMEVPQISSFEKIADILPDYIESEINLRISSMYGYLKHIKPEDMQQREKIEELLKLMKLKTIVKDKSIKINGITKKNTIEKLKKEEFSQTQYALIKRFKLLKINKRTVEDLEEYLLNRIILNLEVILKKTNAKLTDDLLDKIYILIKILYNTARREEDSKDIIEEFMYINFPRNEENFEQSYNIIDGTGVKESKLFRYKFGNTTVKGTMPISSNSDDEQIKSTGPKR